MIKKRVSQVIVEKKDELYKIFHSYQVHKIRMFGSVAYNCDGVNSDIDFLIDMPLESNLIDYANLKSDLEDVLKLPTDILTYSSLNKETLDYFIENSISLDELKGVSNRRIVEIKRHTNKKVTLNLNSLVWVINRIESHIGLTSKESYLMDEILKDALSRNIQLLGQIVSQIPNSEWHKIKTFEPSRLKSILLLKEALFMNVDHNLLWASLNELKDLKIDISNELDHRQV